MRSERATSGSEGKDAADDLLGYPVICFECGEPFTPLTSGDTQRLVDLRLCGSL
jgi:hypothetical protein